MPVIRLVNMRLLYKYIYMYVNWQVFIVFSNAYLRIVLFFIDINFIEFIDGWLVCYLFSTSVYTVFLHMFIFLEIST